MNQKVTTAHGAREKIGELPSVVAHTRARFFFLWQHMVYSKTQHEFDAALQLLRSTFAATQPALVEYLEEERLPHKEEWAGCYTRLYRNYGCLTTSPNECTNCAVKSRSLSLR